MKYLALDYGSKKIGVAISDEMGMFAFPFKIILNKNKENSLEEFLKIVSENNISTIVVGESLNQKGVENKILEEAKSFVKILEEKSKAKIVFEKEWFSTVEARRYDDRRDADDSAAAIILQRFLDKENRK
ncbi:MAG: Holliday junction resolvase RuvX [Candidatus Nomurabacteria bacterium]